MGFGFFCEIYPVKIFYKLQLLLAVYELHY